MSNISRETRIKQQDCQKTQEYWNQNIEKWGELYLRISHSEERLNAPLWLESLYHTFITPIEARLMRERYMLTMSFIEQHISTDMVTVDVGCGTGIFSVAMLKKGASVIAVDYTPSSLDLTRRAVETLVPQSSSKIRYILMDVARDVLPLSDVALVMGVTPYVNNVSNFMGNLLTTTDKIYCLFLDPKHWSNKLRKIFPILNVRSLHFHDKDTINNFYNYYGWELLDRKMFASGYLDLAIHSTRIS